MLSATGITLDIRVLSPLPIGFPDVSNNCSATLAAGLGAVFAMVLVVEALGAGVKVQWAFTNQSRPTTTGSLKGAALHALSGMLKVVVPDVFPWVAKVLISTVGSVTTRLKFLGARVQFGMTTLTVLIPSGARLPVLVVHTARPTTPPGKPFTVVNTESLTSVVSALRMVMSFANAMKLNMTLNVIVHPRDAVFAAGGIVNVSFMSLLSVADEEAYGSFVTVQALLPVISPVVWIGSIDTA